MVLYFQACYMARVILLSLTVLFSAISCVSCQEKKQASPPPPSQVSGPKYSPKLQALLDRAQSGTSVPIHIETYTLSPGEPEPLQGNTRHADGGIFITVASGISKEYEEALLAHELFHVILDNKKFNAGAGLKSPYRIPYMTMEDSMQSLHHIGTTLTSCFPDGLIDRETAKLGFKPELLTDRQVELILNQLRDASIPPDAAVKTVTIMQKGSGLELFCLAKRRRDIPMDQIEKGESLISPEIVKAEKDLLKIFSGAQCKIDDPNGCYALTLKLRDAVGLNGILYLRNPYTLAPE